MVDQDIPVGTKHVTYHVCEVELNKKKEKKIHDNFIDKLPT